VFFVLCSYLQQAGSRWEAGDGISQSSFIFVFSGLWTCLQLKPELDGQFFSYKSLILQLLWVPEQQKNSSTFVTLLV
jgi:hypothetical protein